MLNYFIGDFMKYDKNTVYSFYKEFINYCLNCINKDNDYFYNSINKKTALNIGIKDNIITNILCKNFKHIYGMSFSKEDTKAIIKNTESKNIELCYIEPKNFNKISEKIKTESIDFVTCINTFDYLSISQCKTILSEIYKLMNANSYCIIVVNRTMKEIISSDFPKFIENFGFKTLEKGSAKNFEDFFIIGKTT